MVLLVWLTHVVADSSFISSTIAESFVTHEPDLQNTKENSIKSHNKHANGVSELINKTSHKFSQRTVSTTLSQRPISFERPLSFFETFEKIRTRAPSGVLQGLVDRMPPLPVRVGRFDIPNKSTVIEKEINHTIDDAHIAEKVLTEEAHQKGKSDLINKTRFSSMNISTTAPQLRITFPPPRVFHSVIKKPNTTTPSVALQGLLHTDPPLIVHLDKTDTPNKTNIVEKDINESHIVKDVLTEEAHKENDSEIYLYLTIYGNKMFAEPVYKHLVPIILGFCLMTTTVFVFVLGKRLRKSSSPLSNTTCLLLISIALADVLTMGCAAAEIVYLYSETNRNNGFLLFDKCKTMFILERLSAIPHAASTWFTVGLAIQRYICISRPFTAGQYINIKSSCVVLLFISFLTISLHICRFFDKTFTPVSIQVLASSGNETIETCVGKFAKWIVDPVLYESWFAWIRIILAQLLPSIFLLCFVYLLVRKLRHTTQITTRMQITGSKLSSKRRQLSIFVSVVALIVFTIEMASGVFLSFNAWSISTGDDIFSYESLKAASILFDLILYMSYFSVFLIYCLMSHDFKQTAMSVCFLAKCRKRTYSDNIQQYSGGRKS